MNVREQWLSIEEAREIDMVEYLSKSGHEPAKTRNNDYWYLSPLRNEKTSSFKVNRKLNRWYDHGLGKGGNIIDFGVLYHNCTVAEFLQKISRHFSFQPLPITSSSKEQNENTESKISIVNERPLSSLVLCCYLSERKIPMEVAKLFCKEVTHQLNEKEYFRIGFKNDLGGYEIRNPYFKASSSPKGLRPSITAQKKLLFSKVLLTFFLSKLFIKISFQKSLILLF